MVLEGLDHPLSQKMNVVANHFTKARYSYKQASFSCFVDQGPKMLATSALMVLFKPLGNDCDPRYLKPTIFPFLDTLRLV